MGLVSRRSTYLPLLHQLTIFQRLGWTGCWMLDLDAGPGCWAWMLDLDAGLGRRTWTLDLDAGPGCWTWTLDLDAGSGCWTWTLDLDFGSGCWTWTLDLDFGPGCWTWTLDLDTGPGLWNWTLEPPDLIKAADIAEGWALMLCFLVARLDSGFFQLWLSSTLALVRGLGILWTLAQRYRPLDSTLTTLLLFRTSIWNSLVYWP